MTMMIKKLHILFVVLFLLCIKSFSLGFESAHEDANSTIVRCIERERHALLMFKRGIIVSKFEDLSSWGSQEDCCKWKGVGCSNLTGHVTSLYLRNVKHVSIKMTSSLIELKSLNQLDFNQNDFGSTPIPNFIGSLTGLVYLDLSSSNLSGPIPYQLRNLSNLMVLDLSNNNFVSNPIPDFIGSFTKLEDLRLSVANFSGAIPYQLRNLSSLNYLDLGYNEGLYSKDGNLEWLSSLSSLTFLDLSGIDLSRANGWVDIIKTLPFLSYLNLGGCNLSQVTTPSLSSLIELKSLNRLEFSGNDFGSMPIPNFIGSLTSLVYLDLSSSNLSGPIPKSLGTLCNLKSLRLEWNNLNGSLEDFSSGCAINSLEYLYLYHNQFAGPLVDFKGWSSLKLLDLSYNQFDGPLVDFKGCSSLEDLDLSNNQYTGSVPVFRECPSLIRLILSNNQFSALLPETVDTSNNLRWLDISNNSLEVVITNEHFSNISYLFELKLLLTPSLSIGALNMFPLSKYMICF